MIAVVGKRVVTLKRIMMEQGFPQLGDVRTPITGLINGVFNCSYTPNQLSDRVLRHCPDLRDGTLPIINRTLVPNKQTAQETMYANGLSENILVCRNMGVSPADYARDPDGWIIKPYASQGGVGIRPYRGGNIPSGHYLQKKVNKFREFRAHVGLWLPDPVFTIQEKKPKPELWEQIFSVTEYEWPAGEIQREALPLTWNINSGFYLRRSTTPENRAQKVARFPLFRRIEELAIKAVKALGYQYGAVDIMMDEDRQLWVSEVNSHPAIINPQSKEIYAEVLEPLKTISVSRLEELTGGGTTRRSLRRTAYEF